MDIIGKEQIQIITEIKGVKNDLPFIYLKGTITPMEIIPFENLFHVVGDLGDSSLYSSGIPEELISVTDMAFSFPVVRYSKSGKVTYFSPPYSDTKENVLRVIQIFNQLAEELVIYTSSDIYFYVKGFSNSNIEFHCYENIENVSFTSSCVISYGFYARKFVERKIPTFVMGPYGFGGLVTKDNIDYLLKNNFSGRPGGNLNEEIPLMLFVDEIVEMRGMVEHNEMSSLLDKNQTIVKEFLSRFKNPDFITCISNIQSRYSRMKNLGNKSKLRPRLVSNVELIRNNGTVMVQRKFFYDLLFSLPESESNLLDDLMGELTCHELQDKYQMETEEFLEVIEYLWRRKAIVLL